MVAYLTDSIRNGICVQGTGHFNHRIMRPLIRQVLHFVDRRLVIISGVLHGVEDARKSWWIGV